MIGGNRSDDDNNASCFKQMKKILAEYNLTAKPQQWADVIIDYNDRFMQYLYESFCAEQQGDYRNSITELGRSRFACFIWSVVIVCAFIVYSVVAYRSRLHSSGLVKAQPFVSDIHAVHATRLSRYLTTHSDIACASLSDFGIYIDVFAIRRKFDGAVVLFENAVVYVPDNATSELVSVSPLMCRGKFMETVQIEVHYPIQIATSSSSTTTTTWTWLSEATCISLYAQHIQRGEWLCGGTEERGSSRSRRIPAPPPLDF